MKIGDHTITTNDDLDVCNKHSKSAFCRSQIVSMYNICNNTVPSMLYPFSNFTRNEEAK